MTTSTATPTITPLGPLTPVDGRILERTQAATFTREDNHLHLDFRYAMQVPVLEGNYRAPRLCLMEGEMRITLPIVNAETVLRDRVWVDPDTGGFWHLHQRILDVDGYGEDNDLWLGIPNDGPYRDFIYGGAVTAVPKVVGRILHWSSSVRAGDIAGFAVREAPAGGMYVTGLQELPMALARTLRASLKSTGAIPVVDGGRDGWHLVYGGGEPIAVMGKYGRFYLGELGKNQGSFDVFVRVDDPAVTRQMTGLDVAPDVGRYLSAPTLDVARHTAAAALAAARDEMVQLVANPDYLPDGDYIDQLAVLGEASLLTPNRWRSDVHEAALRMEELAGVVRGFRDL